MIFNWSKTRPDFDRLIQFLRNRHGDDLRWVASFNSESYDYDVKYVREDLKTELSSHDFEVVVHRTAALFRRPYVEKVYTHLGDAESLVLQHERATAVHIYLTEQRGTVIKIRAGNTVEVPDFVDECLEQLYPEGRE